MLFFYLTFLSTLTLFIFYFIIFLFQFFLGIGLSFYFLTYNFYCFGFYFSFLSQFLFQFYSFSLFFNVSLFVQIFYHFSLLIFFPLFYFLYRSYYYIYSFEISVIHGPVVWPLYKLRAKQRETYGASVNKDTSSRLYSIVSEMSLCTMFPLQLIGETILHVSFGKAFWQKQSIPHLSVPISR